MRRTALYLVLISALIACSKDIPKDKRVEELAKDNAELRKQIEKTDSDLHEAKKSMIAISDQVEMADSRIRELESLMLVAQNSGSVPFARQRVSTTQAPPEPEYAEPSYSPSRSGPVTNQPRADAEIRSACAQKWPGDFRMQSYCEDEQTKAKKKVEASGPTDVPMSVFEDIREGCAGKWGEDYRMRAYCEDEQAKAWRKIQ